MQFTFSHFECFIFCSEGFGLYSTSQSYLWWSGAVLPLRTIDIQGVSLHALLFLIAEKKQVRFCT